MLRRLLVAVSVVLALGSVMATPVSAQPNWQTYNLSQGVWDCREPYEVQKGVHLRACVHFNSNSHAQAVAILSNYSGSHYTITGPDVDLFAAAAPGGPYNRGWDGACGSHRLLNNTSRACLGPTEGPFCDWLQARVRVTVGGISYRQTSEPSYVCVG